MQRSIDAVWQKLIKGKKEAFQRDKAQKIVILVAITLIIVSEQKKEKVVIDIILVTQTESMTHIPGTNREIKKTHKTHTVNTEEDDITEDNKLIKTQIIKTRIIFIT